MNRQLANCLIYAPHAGMAVYARDARGGGGGGRGGFTTSEIAEGATVRDRQELLALPDLTKMQIRTSIHEAVLDQVRPGLPVTVRVDAFPNRTYDGVVTQVAVVPAMNFMTNVKTYDCVVRIIEEVEQLKPGMTAVCEIHVDRLRDVLSVPVQAVVQMDKETWCYVDDAGRVERRPVELGRSNDKFVHLVKGVEAGERVVLNPMAIMTDQQRQDNAIAPDMSAPKAPDIPADVLAQEEARTSELMAKSRVGGRRGGAGRQRGEGAGQGGRRFGSDGESGDPGQWGGRGGDRAQWGGGGGEGGGGGQWGEGGGGQRGGGRRGRRAPDGEAPAPAEGSGADATAGQ
jgi:hypothetical protein